MRVLMACGGTGGHINPALAIADIIKTAYPDAEFLFAGTPKGMEAKLVPQAGYNLETITMEYDGYTDIMPNAFVECSNLKEVIIDGAKTIFVQIFDASTLECTKKYAFNATSERLVLELTASYTSSELRKVTKVS